MIRPSRPDKLLYPASEFGPARDKAAVIDYYDSVAPYMLPHLADRFLTLHRFPDGIEAEGFYQQSRPDHFPDCVRGVRAPRADGTGGVEHMVVDSAQGLRYLADQAALAIHGWQSRCDRPRTPDRLVFDLDPADDDFGTVVDAARLLRDVLELAELTPFMMTTGSRGLHVVAPLERTLEFDDARALAGNLADAVVKRHPERFTREQRRKARRGRLYLDIGRNAYGQTAIVPYSLRALPGAPVATPLEWDELGRSGLSARRFRLNNLFRRLARKDDPWGEFFDRAAPPRLDAGALDAWAEA